jgi:hypothetical protein
VKKAGVAHYAMAALARARDAPSAPPEVDVASPSEHLSWQASAQRGAGSSSG